LYLRRSTTEKEKLKQMSKLSRFSTLVLGGVLALAPALQARTCGGNGDVVGSYGWTATRFAELVVVPVTPPATTTTVIVTTPIVGSSTAIGALAAGAANTAAFASVGRLFLDGNGGVFATSAAGAPFASVGTYNVNTDCTVSVAISDTFATPGGAGLTPVQASATFEGVSVQNGNEIDLVQTGTSGGTLITLKKTRQFNGCSNDGLAGNFGLSAFGVSTPIVLAGATPVSTGFTLVGRFFADGQGNLLVDNVGLASPLTQRQITGTYTVNADCTGTATLVTADGKSRKVGFVVLSPTSASAGGSQSLAIAFTDAGVVGSGSAQQQ
jgi:hypothetical protein